MKIAVMGAGAVGCYYGGMLARAGHQVMLIARPRHVEAIEEQGLRLETTRFDERVGRPHLRASTDPAAIAEAELVLFCVKSADTETAGRQIGEHLAPGATVLTLQNGVDNAERLRQLIAAPVIATVVYVATEMAGPGHLRHHGLGELLLEPSPASEAIAGTLSAAGVPAKVSADVRTALWTKLAINCAYNALSAITQLPYGRLVAGEGFATVRGDILAECVAVAAADGVTLPADIDLITARLAETMPGQYSSTAQDLARSRKSEIAYLNGTIVRRGAAHGIPTPANRLLLMLVRLIEDKAAGGE